MLGRTVAIAAAMMVQAAGSTALAQSVPDKHPLPALSAPACQQIEANADSFEVEEISRTTRYFTPLFEPDENGELQRKDRRQCLKIQGSCVVGDYLYNAGGGPSGKRFERASVSFMFGMGSGRNEYNTTNALFPCRTVAADLRHYKVGTVLFIPALKGRICPQNGRPVDGCFVVGDKGGAIKGQGRFDMFGGECANFDSKKYECRDPKSTTLEVPRGTAFHVVPRDHALARALRDQVDAFVDNGWTPVSATKAAAGNAGSGTRQENVSMRGAGVGARVKDTRGDPKTAEYPEMVRGPRAHACDQARRSGAVLEKPCRD